MNLQFNVSPGATCGTLKFCDDTCIKVSGLGSISYNVFDGCGNGYNYGSNININDIVATSLTYEALDGSSSGTIFSGSTFLPAVPAHQFRVIQSVTVGGTYQIDIDGTNICPVITSTTNDISEFIDIVVSVINNYQSTPNYMASRIDDALFIYAVGVTGASASGLLITVTETGITSTGPVNLIGFGNGESRCFEFQNILTDGLYNMTYTIGDGTSIEVASGVVKVDCSIKECIRPKVLGASEGCGCCQGCQKGFPVDKVNWLYAEMDSVNVLFDEKQYACADDVLKRLAAKCSKLCSNC